MAMDLPILKYDVVIVGAGGAGLRAALELANSGLRTVVVSKVFPTRSHTVAAQGGISAPFGNCDEEDNWHWHMYDTVKGSDWLGDQDAIEFMCSRATAAVAELEHFGMPFDRLENGKLYQRSYGGHSAEFGKKSVRRACAVADRTGHAMLHTLYQQNVAANTAFLTEWFVLDLLRDDSGSVIGVAAMELASGQVYLIHAKAVLLATGGAGRVFRNSTNAYINTGDGLGMALRAGLPLEDMEFWQFHPTGMYGIGSLITEGVRGEGGYLLNGAGERFMERYAPNAKDLASRDVVARAIQEEINAGLGCGAEKDYVLLKLDHLGEEIIQERLPGIRELSLQFLGLDPLKEAIPVVPTAHYMMGGIPTNYRGEVVDGVSESIVPGLYAAGECACASVHGANRLGCNSLLDLLVFGKSAAESIISYIANGVTLSALPRNINIKSLTYLEKLYNSTGGEKVGKIRQQMQTIMQRTAGVFRTRASLLDGLKELGVLEVAVGNLYVADKSRIFNTAVIEALELYNLLGVARATLQSAINRCESRGAHHRVDYPMRDDDNWLRHSLFYSCENKLQYKAVHTKPLTVAKIEPAMRVY